MRCGMFYKQSSLCTGRTLVFHLAGFSAGRRGLGMSGEWTPDEGLEEGESQASGPAARSKAVK